MSPKEKAEELIKKFMISLYDDFQPDTSHTKRCALICVDEILLYYPVNDERSQQFHNYWLEVKQHITNHD